METLLIKLFGPSYRTTATGLAQFLAVLGAWLGAWSDGNAATVPDTNVLVVSFGALLMAINSRDKNVSSETQAAGRSGIAVPKVIPALFTALVLGTAAVGTVHMVGCTGVQLAKFDKAVADTETSMQAEIDASPDPVAKANAQARLDEWKTKVATERAKIKTDAAGNVDWITSLGSAAAVAFPGVGGLILLAMGAAKVVKTGITPPPVPTT